MADVPKTIKQWQMTEPTVYNRETKETTPGKLEKVEILKVRTEGWRSPY